MCVQHDTHLSCPLQAICNGCAPWIKSQKDNLAARLGSGRSLCVAQRHAQRKDQAPSPRMVKALRPVYRRPCPRRGALALPGVERVARVLLGGKEWEKKETPVSGGTGTALLRQDSSSAVLRRAEPWIWALALLQPLCSEPEDSWVSGIKH